VAGADAASAYLAARGISSEDCHRVWVAVAVHSSPGIAERIDPLARLIRLAVKADFSRDFAAEMGVTHVCEEIEALLPRLDAEKALTHAVICGAATETVDSRTWPSTRRHPAGSWPGILLRAHRENPGWEGVNPAF
jgi:hypothetical protein